ncbi:DUF1217 domain-containing protein [Planktotalea sp.]|uniref:DUF1217 domain-containing protein n=1 Tax=Planktotalea sp. TaxID=2029877 RepID=UPI003D6B23A4
MTFQPFVLGTGLVAWRNLQRTLPTQLDAFAESSEQKRLVDHFEQSAPSLKSAESVVADRQVLTVALGAYGLQDDLENRYFIKRVLSEGTSDSDALANRMTDSRYKRLASDFAMDGLSSLVGVLPSTAENITNQFTEQAFAVAVGNVDENLRLALNAQTEFERLGALDVSNDAKWYLIMSSAPLRSVVESALGLPSSFGQLDIEKQLEVFQEKSLSNFGTDQVDDLAQTDTRSDLIDRFLLMEQISQGQTFSPQNIALQLLST